MKNAIFLYVILIITRSCHENGNSGRHGATQTEGHYHQDVEAVPDKPPAYDDVIVCDDVVSVHTFKIFL